MSGFNWSLSVSATQIAVLESFDRWERNGLHPSDGPFGQFPQFLSNSRQLIRHGLLSFTEGADRKDQSRGWALTERGRLVLMLIREDAREFLESIGPESVAIPRSARRPPRVTKPQP